MVVVFIVNHAVTGSMVIISHRHSSFLLEQARPQDHQALGIVALRHKHRGVDYSIRHGYLCTADHAIERAELVISPVLSRKTLWRRVAQSFMLGPNPDACPSTARM
jgi:hypothetical protein